jgi:hypothetical protein
MISLGKCKCGAKKLTTQVLWSNWVIQRFRDEYQFYLYLNSFQIFAINLEWSQAITYIGANLYGPWHLGFHLAWERPVMISVLGLGAILFLVFLIIFKAKVLPQHQAGWDLGHFLGGLVARHYS